MLKETEWLEIVYIKFNITAKLIRAISICKNIFSKIPIRKNVTSLIVSYHLFFI